MTRTLALSSRSARGPDIVLGHPFFAGADRQELRKALASATARIVRAGEAVALPSGPPQLHLVLTGLLRCYRLASNGRQLLLELIPPGGFDGLVQMSGRPGHYTVAVEDSLVVSLSPEALNRVLTVTPKVAINLIWAAAHRLATREAQIEAVAAHNLVIGVASVLLLLADRNGVQEGDLTLLPLRLTHLTISEMLGVRRETVTSAIRQLKKLGAVQKVKGRYALDVLALEDVSGL